MNYYYSIDDKQVGPVSFEELQKIDINRKTLIWHKGMSDWEVAESIEELKDFFKFKNTPPPLPVSTTINPPLLPNKSSKKSSAKENLLLEKFKNEFLNKGIYHSENQFSNNINVQIGYVKKTKLKWLATQLNTFIIVGTTESQITKQLIQDFSSEAFRFAKSNNQGLPRGLHSSIGVIAILIGVKANFEAKRYCLKLSKHFSAFNIPVIVETESNDIIHFEGTPIWGMMYYPYLKKLIDKYVVKIIS